LPTPAPAGERDLRAQAGRSSSPSAQQVPGSAKSANSAGSGPHAAPLPHRLPTASPALVPQIPETEAADAGPNAAPDSEIAGPAFPAAPNATTRPKPATAPNLPVPPAALPPVEPGLPVPGTPPAGAAGAGIDSVPVPPPDESGAAAEPEAESGSPAASPAPRRRQGENLNGSWEIRNVVNSTSVAGYRGLRLTYRILLRQEGGRISGDGEKWAENDRRIPAAQRTPIHVSGEVVGREVRVRFTERGSRRVSAGSFRWRLAPDGGSFSGTFASNAADSRGSSAAVRLP
jgi:hypothetical protein